MLFTSRGKSIPLLSLLANTWKGNLLSLNVMLPVRFGCEIGNLCFLAGMLQHHIPLKQKQKDSTFVLVSFRLFLGQKGFDVYDFALPKPTTSSHL